MRTLFTIPLVFLAACSSTPKLVMRTQEPPPVLDERAPRYAEVTRAYYIGRYVDPNDQLVLHEQHVVYRVEARSHWNLHPGSPCITATDAATPQRDPAFAPFPVNDAILAEVNAQKAATTAISIQARQLSGALEQFQAALSQTKTNLQETVAMRAFVAAVEKRVSKLETEQKSAIAPANVSIEPVPTPNP